MKIIRLVQALSFVFCLLSLSVLNADWLNLTGAETSPNIAEIYVQDDHVKLVLEVYIGDLDKFEELIPDSWLTDEAKERPALSQRLEHFANTTFQFITDKGDNLPAELVLVEPRMRVDRQSPFAGMINPMTRQRVPEAPSDKRVLYAELRYPFKEKPGELTIVPPQDEEGMARASIGFIAFHKSVPIIDFRYLGLAPKLHLDWEDPWYTKFENPNLKRHHKSALMSFLYMEPYEVRHEILTRVKDLEQWIDLGLKGDEYIEVDELDGLKQRIGDFLLTKNPVTIDGRTIKPILDRISFVKVGLKGIQIMEKPERQEISTAIIGVIFVYPVNGLPKEVFVDWELFTDQIQRIPTIATDPAGPFKSYIDPDDPQLKWTNYLKNYTDPTVVRIEVDKDLLTRPVPVVSILLLILLVPLFSWYWSSRKRSADKPLVASLVALLLIGSAGAAYPYLQYSVPMPAAMALPMTEAQGKALLNTLLKNVYRAFDFREETDVYDKLVLSVSGDLLTEIYLQNRQSFAVQQAGGAQAKIKEVEVTDLTLKPHADKSMAYVLDARWSAMGTVGHWGHIHIRKNLYHAYVTIEAIDGNWTITGLDVIDEERVQPGSTRS